MSAEFGNPPASQGILAAHFEAIVDIAADAIISVDDTHRVVLFNKGAEEIFGYRSDEIVGQPLDILIPERFRARHGDHIRAFAGAETVARRMGERREIFGLRKGGVEFPAEASISKIAVDGSWLFTVVLRDVSDRKHAEEEKSRLLEAEREARRAAERASRLRDEILGVVSHDLRNPLSVIGMCARALKEELADADARVVDTVTTISDATGWMQRMVRDLLDVANIEAGRLSIERRPADLVITLVKALNAFEAPAAERSVDLIGEIPDRLPLASADGDRVQQVLSNLLGNALKFTEEGGRVTLRAAADGGELIVSVIDTGVGIPPEEIPFLFDRFWHSRRNSNVRGSGLGLAIARGIIVAHSGRIWAESQPGRGSTFHFTLPAWEADTGSQKVR
jgi:PAS domain S-box-containing protein